MPTHGSHATSHFMAMVIVAISFTVFKIFAVKLYMTLTLTFSMAQGQKPKCQSNRKPICDFLCWQTKCLPLSVIVSHESPIVLYSTRWTSKWRSTTSMILIKFGRRTYVLNIELCKNNGASRFIRLFPATFCDGHTDTNTVSSYNTVGTV